MTRRWLAAAFVLALPSTVVAQSGAIRLGVAGVQAERVAPAGTRQLSGMGWTLDGAFGVGPATLTIRYLEGPLELDGGGDAPDLVEGEALLWVAPLRWIAVGGGAHGRAYVQDGSTERWLFWEARVRGTARLVGPALAAYLEGWTVFSSDIDVPEPLDSGRGSEARMVSESTIATLLEKEIPGFTMARAGESFATLGVDSFAMLELRIAIEHAIGATIPDTVWVQIDSPAQVDDVLDLFSAVLFREIQ